jgi:hypothetical protein
VVENFFSECRRAARGLCDTGATDLHDAFHHHILSVHNLACTSLNHPHPPNKVVDLKAAGFTSEERRAKGDDGARRFAHRARMGIHNKITSDQFPGPDQHQDMVASAEFTRFRDVAVASRRRHSEMLAIRNPIMPNEDRRTQAALRCPNPTFDPTARPSCDAFLPPITQGRESNGMLVSSTTSNEHASRSFKSSDGDLLERVRQCPPSPTSTALTERRTQLEPNDLVLGQQPSLNKNEMRTQLEPRDVVLGKQPSLKKSKLRTQLEPDDVALGKQPGLKKNELRTQLEPNDVVLGQQPSLKKNDATLTSSRTVRASTAQQRLCVLRHHESSAPAS